MAAAAATTSGEERGAELLPLRQLHSLDDLSLVAAALYWPIGYTALSNLFISTQPSLTSLLSTCRRRRSASAAAASAAAAASRAVAAAAPADSNSASASARWRANSVSKYCRWLSSCEGGRERRQGQGEHSQKRRFSGNTNHWLPAPHPLRDKSCISAETLPTKRACVTSRWLYSVASASSLLQGACDRQAANGECDAPNNLHDPCSTEPSAATQALE